MILGMSAAVFTMLHVALSVSGILCGAVTLAGMLASKRVAGWTVFFLATTVLTSLTGFLFPRDRLLPSHVVGIISLTVLASFFVLGFAAIRSFHPVR